MFKKGNFVSKYNMMPEIGYIYHSDEEYIYILWGSQRKIVHRDEITQKNIYNITNHDKVIKMDDDGFSKTFLIKENILDKGACTYPISVSIYPFGKDKYHLHSKFIGRLEIKNEKIIDKYLELIEGRNKYDVDLFITLKIKIINDRNMEIFKSNIILEK